MNTFAPELNNCAAEKTPPRVLQGEFFKHKGLSVPEGDRYKSTAPITPITNPDPDQSTNHTLHSVPNKKRNNNFIVCSKGTWTVQKASICENLSRGTLFFTPLQWMDSGKSSSLAHKLPERNKTQLDCAARREIRSGQSAIRLHLSSWPPPSGPSRTFCTLQAATHSTQ